MRSPWCKGVFSAALAIVIAGRLQADERTNAPAQEPQKVLRTLDDLRIFTLSPPSGSTIPGPPESTTGSGLDDSNSILITYQYKLQSSDHAEIVQWAWKAPNLVAHNNFWTSHNVSKGTGFAKNRLTVRCKDASQPDTTVRFVNYKFVKMAGGGVAPEPNVLVERAEPVNFRFTCGPMAQVSEPLKIGFVKTVDDLKVVSVSPPSGSTIKGPTSAAEMNLLNSIKITYQYDLKSSAQAQIRQWALRAPNVVDPNNFWTWSPVSKGNGTATTQLTVICKNSSQAPTTITAINYKLIKAAGEKIAPEPNLLVDRVQPVNFTFTCGPK